MTFFSSLTSGTAPSLFLDPHISKLNIEHDQCAHIWGDLTSTWSCQWTIYLPQVCARPRMLFPDCREFSSQFCLSSCPLWRGKNVHEFHSDTSLRWSSSVTWLICDIVFCWLPGSYSIYHSVWQWLNNVARGQKWNVCVPFWQKHTLLVLLLA